MISEMCCVMVFSGRTILFPCHSAIPLSSASSAASDRIMILVDWVLFSLYLPVALSWVAAYLACSVLPGAVTSSSLNTQISAHPTVSTGDPAM